MLLRPLLLYLTSLSAFLVSPSLSFSLLLSFSPSISSYLGSSLSLTVTVKLQSAVLPAPSCTTYVWRVAPLGKAAPLASPAVRVVIEPAQLSVPTGSANVTTAVHVPASMLTVISAGHVICGPSESVTVTPNEHVTELLSTSVAEFVRDNGSRNYEHAVISLFPSFFLLFYFFPTGVGGRVGAGAQDSASCRAHARD